VRKLARRDIAGCIIDGATGATTVSATMHLAAAAGIEVFATGGVGGVHRLVSESWDVSADLYALSDIPVMVVSAGIKSLLDIPKSLELLESLSVPVATLRPDDGEFPSFYTRKSGSKTPFSVQDEASAARMFRAQRNLFAARPTGMLLAVPVPRAHEADPAIIAQALRTALAEAKEQGITGQATTPFLLGYIAEVTTGHSLDANIHLVKNNAAVAARVAVHLCNNAPTATPGPPAFPPPQVLVAGGLALDISCAPNAGTPLLRGTSNPGTILQSIGGVARNIATVIHQSGTATVLCAAVGRDLAGETILTGLRLSGMRCDGVGVVDGGATATYCAINGADGNLDLAVSSFEATSLPILRDIRINTWMSAANMLCVDGNLAVADIDKLVTLANQHDVPVWFEPTSVVKSAKVLVGETKAFASLQWISPNTDELVAIWLRLHGETSLTAGCMNKLIMDDIAQDVLRCGHRNLTIVLTRGVEGVVLYSRSYPESGLSVPAAPVPGGVVTSSSGAGDVLAGTMIACLINGTGCVDAAHAGVRAAAECCSVFEAVPPPRPRSKL
jgi:pseudouridylate synthase / pseudouridine kinase